MARTIKYQDEKESINEKQPTMGSETKRPRRMGFFWIVLLLAVVLGAWAFSYFNLLPGSDVYQAVFLNNGQVYFGKLSRVGSQYPILKDIYYLQITQPLQPGDGSTAEDSPANINLVKLGGELHGPQDEMRINRDSILFIEKLKTDSTVVQNIQKSKEGQ